MPERKRAYAVLHPVWQKGAGMAKPVIKWVGGKAKLLPEIKKRMPPVYGRYIEPFFGGGALYFNLLPENAVIGDINQPLIHTYLNIKKNPYAVMELLDAMETEFNGMENADERIRCYMKRREEFNICIMAGQDSAKTSALFIFLNKTCFNGLYRVNKSGMFNVPSGKKEKVSLYSRDAFLEVSHALPRQILCSGFEETLAYADPQKGDFVFLDSPYMGTYTGYGKDGFSKESHIRLRDAFAEMDSHGVYCMAANSNTDAVKELYKGYKIETLDTIHSVNRNGSQRRAKEVLITNY